MWRKNDFSILAKKINLFAKEHPYYVDWFRWFSNTFLIRKSIAGLIAGIILTYCTVRLLQFQAYWIIPLVVMNLILLGLPFTKKGEDFVESLNVSFLTIQRLGLLFLLAFDIIILRHIEGSHMIPPAVSLFVIWSTSFSFTWSRSVERASFETVCFGLVYGFIYPFQVSDIFILFMAGTTGLLVSFICQLAVKTLFYLFYSSEAMGANSEERAKKLEALIRSLAHSLGGFTMTIDLISFRNLNSPDIPAESKEEWGDIQRSIRDLNSVVRDIRTIQKTTSGEEEVQLEGVRVYDIFQKLYDHFDEETHRKNLDFNTNLVENENTKVWANKEVVFSNICTVLVTKLIERSQEWDSLVMNCYRGRRETLICLSSEQSLPNVEELKKYIEVNPKRPDLENAGGILYLSIVDFFVKQLGGHFFVVSSTDEESKEFAYILIFKNVNTITLKELNLIAS